MHPSFRIWLRLEALAVLIAAALVYWNFRLPWLWFVVLFLAPDLSMSGYLAGHRTGAWIYNLAHTYALALGLFTVGLVAGNRATLGIGLIWCAHIGFDRAMGYGLKSPEGFRFTHLGKIGRDKDSATAR
jgi:hypothetical protein